MPSGRFINLRAKPFKDSDLILDVLSKDGERLTLTAKGALNSRRRFVGGVLEPLNFVEIYFTKSKAGFLYVQEAKVIEAFAGLRKDYAKLELAFHLVKLISKATYEGLSDNKRLFDLLGNSLKVLETTDRPHLLRLQFELKYLYYLGFLALDEDTNEFVAKPVTLHRQIELTEEEYLYLNQHTQRLLRSSELIALQNPHSESY